MRRNFDHMTSRVSRRGRAVVGGWVALLVTATLSSGCGAISSQAANVGSDVVGSLREKEPEIFDIERRLADSAGTFLSRSIEDKVLGRVSGLWDTMLLKANEQAGSVMGKLAAGVERDLNRSLQIALEENLRLTDSAGRAAVAGIVNSAMGTARSNADPLVDEVVAALERGLRTRLRPVLVEVVNEVADSLGRRIEAVDRQLANSETGKRASGTVYGIIAALGVVVIGGGIAWRRSTNRNRAAIFAAKQALESNAPGAKQKLEQDLRDKGFHRQADWLE